MEPKTEDSCSPVDKKPVVFPVFHNHHQQQKQQQNGVHKPPSSSTSSVSDSYGSDDPESSSAGESKQDTSSSPPAPPPPEVDYEKLKQFEFRRPPECPVYRPTLEEFLKGPIDYITKIRPEAEPYGICKIIPPKEFQVPFAIDRNEFHFTPRTQRINDLEAMSRIRLNFTDRLSKFWNLQGVQLRIPTIQKKYLDVYQFHSIVKEEGGFEICTRDRKWGKIAMLIGYTRNNSSSLRAYYEKVLFPFDIFLSGATTHPDVTYSNGKEEKPDVEMKTEEKPEIKPDLNGNINGNLQTTVKRELEEEEEETFCIKKRFCFNCNDNHQSYSLLTCQKCRNSFHKACLIPPFNDVPKGQWHCHSCLARILETLPKIYTSEFGFTQSRKTYTLKEFGEMADEFKEKYFRCPPQNVPYSDLEKEFWRIVSTPFENVVCVEYGADLYTNDYGSGFPTDKNSALLTENQKAYIKSPWNLNNLPTLFGSVFEHINQCIDGMIIPWMYVGMCFSAFCWHNEDHWTYSINYLHWGEPKSWYGVPGDKAEVFENAMRKLAPDLFTSQPDLLHHLVTTCNPNHLIKLGVPIYRTDQCAGEFVVTFPRSYHAGFNQGFNFAEAVNFATADWMPIGRLSMSHYSTFHRYPVFSHDELICKMVDGCKDLNKQLALATYDDLKEMIRNEGLLRFKIFSLGIHNTEYFSFETLKDDERQCDFCKTTCFLSAIKCPCKSENIKLVCPNHYDELCSSCPYHKFILLYRYTMDELKIMEHQLSEHIKRIN